jgi:hypothetical protein
MRPSALSAGATKRSLALAAATTLMLPATVFLLYNSQTLQQNVVHHSNAWTLEVEEADDVLLPTESLPLIYGSKHDLEKPETKDGAQILLLAYGRFVKVSVSNKSTRKTFHLQIRIHADRSIAVPGNKETQLYF